MDTHLHTPVHFFGAGVFEDGTPFLVTELLERGSLSAVLENAPKIAWSQKLGFARDIANGEWGELFFVYKYLILNIRVKNNNNNDVFALD